MQLTKLDQTGNVKLPKNLKKAMNLTDGESFLRISHLGGKLIIEPVTSCAICESKETLRSIQSKVICKLCLDQIVAL